MLLDLLAPTATDDGRAYQLLALERSGIRPQHLQELQDCYELSDQHLLELLSLNRRTLQRRRGDNEPLSASTSANFLEAARVLTFASEVFGDDEKVKRWMHRPNRVLGNESPLSLLATSTGRGLVRDVLGRIAHGVYA